MIFKEHEEDYIERQVDSESIRQQAEKIYERRLESLRHYEYQPVFVTCGTFAGKRLLVEVNGHNITGVFLR